MDAPSLRAFQKIAAKNWQMDRLGFKAGGRKTQEQWRPICRGAERRFALTAGRSPCANFQDEAMTETLLDLDAINAAHVSRVPYPYFVSEKALKAGTQARVFDDFPPISRPGAIEAEETLYGPEFGRLLQELRSRPFAEMLSDKLNLELVGRPTTVNVRGMMRWTDGNIHTDSPSKLVTVLMYFNSPGQAEGTGLRILNGNHSIEDYVLEVPPVLGTMVAFKVTPDCWHGHLPYEGPRCSLQLNYLSNRKPVVKHQLAYRLWSRFKRKLEKT